jgi:hypothetical protein
MLLIGLTLLFGNAYRAGKDQSVPSLLMAIGVAVVIATKWWAHEAGE